MIRTAVITRVFLEWKLKITCRKILLKELLMNGVAQYTFSIIFNHLSYSGPPQANLPSSSPIFIFYPSLFPLSPSICPSFIFHYFSFLVSQPFCLLFTFSLCHFSYSPIHPQLWSALFQLSLFCLKMGPDQKYCLSIPSMDVTRPVKFFFVAANFLVPYSTLKHH